MAIDTKQPKGYRKAWNGGTPPAEPLLPPLNVKRDGYNYVPVLDRTPNHQTIRERAEFLAHEIFDDRLAPEDEIATAIELEILRFSRERHR